jgi:STAS domain
VDVTRRSIEQDGQDREDPGAPLWVDRGPGGEVVVTGSIDMGTAPVLHKALQEADREGTELVVDLVGVDVLQAAGVEVLAEFADSEPRIIARADTVVDKVLEVCQIEHDTEPRSRRDLLPP